MNETLPVPLEPPLPSLSSLPLPSLPSLPLLQRLDRAWYDYEGGYDVSHNDLAAIPEEYTKKKEEQLAKNTVKRMSAQQRQYNKVSRVFTMQPVHINSHACTCI